MALAGIKQAEAALEQAKVNLEHTTLHSPVEFF
jgi:multidrug resistance efflux pump